MGPDLAHRYGSVCVMEKFGQTVCSTNPIWKLFLAVTPRAALSLVMQSQNSSVLFPPNIHWASTTLDVKNPGQGSIFGIIHSLSMLPRRDPWVDRSLNWWLWEQQEPKVRANKLFEDRTNLQAIQSMNSAQNAKGIPKQHRRSAGSRRFLSKQKCWSEVNCLRSGDIEPIQIQLQLFWSTHGGNWAIWHCPLQE